MTDLTVPSRSLYIANINTGNTIGGSVTVSEKSIVIAPEQSGLTYSLTEANDATGPIEQFPRAT